MDKRPPKAIAIPPFITTTGVDDHTDENYADVRMVPRTRPLACDVRGDCRTSYRLGSQRLSYGSRG